MNDAVGFVFVLQYLIRALTGFSSDARGIVEDFFPRGIVFDFMNDQHMLHGMFLSIRE